MIMVYGNGMAKNMKKPGDRSKYEKETEKKKPLKRAKTVKNV